MSDKRPKPIEGPRVDPFGKEFPWGHIIEVHRIGNYVIAEYLEDTSRLQQPRAWERHGQRAFHVWVNGVDTSTRYPTLDHALLGAIAYAHAGAHTGADFYAARVLGVP